MNPDSQPSASLRSAWVVLVLLGLVAGAVLAGGAWLAQREEKIRTVADREPLERAADSLRRETGRLEALYEADLRRMAAELPLNDDFALRNRADLLAGVSQVSVLHRHPKTGAARQLSIAPRPPEGWPAPVFDAKADPLLRKPVILDPAPFFQGTGDPWGWIDEPGKPLLFWTRPNSETVLVFLLNPAAVAARMTGWVRDSRLPELALLTAPGRTATLDTPAGDSLLAAPPPATTGPPDLLLPVVTRFGTWRLAAWDQWQTRTRHHATTLAGAAALAAVIGLAGLGSFFQQRRALRLAGQRVSFVNRVSHELRTPLTNILLNADLAAESLTDSPPEAARRLGLLHEEARRLGRLVENVLTFARSDQGHLALHPAPCRPDSILDDVTAQFAPALARLGVTVTRTGTIPGPRLLDPDAFAQILVNLFSNVEKYAPGGPLEITLAATTETLTLTLRDHGPGIPPAEAERLFRPFERLSNRATDGVTGTGLGLSIARDLAHRLGGSLKLEAGGRGAAFTLEIPAPSVEGGEVIG